MTSESVALLTYCSPRKTLRPGCSSSGSSPVALAFFASSNSAPEIVEDALPCQLCRRRDRSSMSVLYGSGACDAPMQGGEQTVAQHDI